MGILERLRIKIQKRVSRCSSLYICLTLFALAVQCHSQELTRDDKKIISLIVDKSAFPLPPPPPIESKDTVIAERLIDSLLSLKLVVAIYPVMDAAIEKSGLKDIPNGFQELMDTIPGTKYITTTEGIKSQKGHTIVLPDTTKMKGSYDFNDFDLLFNFSKIWYNKEGTRAIFEVGVSRSRLAGGATIFCLEKVKGKWLVVESVPTTIW